MTLLRDRIIRRVAHDCAAVGILVFLAKNPNGWFDAEAIQAHAGAPARPVKHLLDELVDDGFLVRQRDGETARYALTRHPEVRNAVLFLAGRIA